MDYFDSTKQKSELKIPKISSPTKEVVRPKSPIISSPPKWVDSGTQPESYRHNEGSKYWLSPGHPNWLDPPAQYRRYDDGTHGCSSTEMDPNWPIRKNMDLLFGCS
ncbi:unnamed protein product [Cuscuta epithymum]|uniref:Uncharacterized protein n=1 Tax=Cuscuta epithymum TaxID=186058 RepID=A0AAV0G292_9ASTE|nr:unnamed protein product [Cuscuta epithymum]